MPATRRELILMDVRDTLVQITTANGYLHTMGAVDIGKINPLNYQLYPVALVIPTVDRPEAGATSVSRRELALTIRLWVKPHLELFAGVEAVLQDVQRAMMLDVRRGGEAENTLEGELNYLYLPGDLEEIEAGVDLDYLIHYRTAISDPRIAPV